MLSLDTDSKLQIDPSALTGQRIAVLGISGSGKTNTAATLVEELLPHVPMTIVDTEGEMYGLKERFDILVAGSGDHADLPAGADQAGALAEWSWEHNLSVILDMSDFDKAEQEAFLLAYFERLWKAANARPQPYMVLIEECHEFIPENGRTPLKDILLRLAARGRKRGVGMIVVSQRSSKVSKDVLTQCGIFFLHRVTHPVDMAVYKEFIPLKSAEVEKIVRDLSPGKAIVLHNQEPQVVQIRRRHTFHAGATPGLIAVAGPELRKVNDALLGELKEVLAKEADAPPAAGDEVALRKQIAEKDIVIADLRAKLQRMEKKANLEKVAAANGTALPDSGGSRMATDEYRSPLATVRGINKQQRGFDGLLRDVMALPIRWQRRVLVYLMEREDRCFTASELARFTGLSKTTIQHNAPLDLIRWGLVTREKRAGEFCYKAHAREHLTNTFPDLELEDLIEQLLGIEVKV